MDFEQWRRLSESSADIAAVRELDAALSANKDIHYEPDPTGRFETALTAGKVWCLRENGQVVAFVHIEEFRNENKKKYTPKESTVEIAAVAVHPELHGRGRGSRLVRHCLAHIDSDRRLVWATVSPRNVFMLGILFKHGFVASTYLSNYINGKDRVLLQRPTFRPVDSEDMSIVSLDKLPEVLADSRVVVTGTIGRGSGQTFTLKRWPPSVVPLLVQEADLDDLRQ